MDILRAEIERKRKILEEKNVIVSTVRRFFSPLKESELINLTTINVQNEKKKFFKGSELYSQTPEKSQSLDSSLEENDICDKKPSSKLHRNLLFDLD